MGKKRHTAEEIITKLREADVLQAKGQTLSEACRQIEVSEQTYYNWRKEYGGLRVDQAKRFKEIEQENIAERMKNSRTKTPLPQRHIQKSA